MEQTELNLPKKSRLESLSRDELVERSTILEQELERVLRAYYKLRGQEVTAEQIKLLLEEQIGSLRDQVYGASSERYKKPEKEKKENLHPPKPRTKKPSERYPNIPVREEFIKMDPPPSCGCCGKVMSDSGMTEDAEQLTVIPKKYEIVRQKRAKYRCDCHGDIKTAPLPPRIVEGSTYSNEMIIDVVASKFCDLLPIERYCAMAKRTGLLGLPPHSLIEVTHSFADFVSRVYTMIKKEVMQARVLHADETPHRMLEGSEKKSWYLWGFSTAELCFLECRDTRSGDVASEVLLKSKCEVLVTDVYAGYGKAIRITNQERLCREQAIIKNANCNAHARRYFFKPWQKYKEAAFYLDHYHEIYQLESKAKGKPPPEILKIREQMKPRFEGMKKRAMEELPNYPAHNMYARGLRYFIENYDGLTLFLTDADVAIDNNSQERLLRSHVVGRKTWYGTHSERGALTAAILFSIVETCKLNNVNPREYFDHIVQDLLAGAKPYTPKDFKTSRQI